MAYSFSRYMPNVSIIMPTYNSHQWISDSIQSVLEQYYEQWELLIVDDGSTDNTKNIVKDFLNDKRIKYYYQENYGPATARNFGISKASRFTKSLACCTVIGAVVAVFP